MSLIVLLYALCLRIGDVEIDKYPIPKKTKEQLFYIQRNHNKNTIVYDANFDKNGNLINSNPINVYWIRYEENGQKMGLRMIEKLYAYGVKCTAIKNIKNQYNVKLVADEDRKLILKQSNPFDAAIFTMINKQYSQLQHIYIYADNSGFWPKVKYIELFGKEIVSQKNNYEKIIINK